MKRIISVALCIVFAISLVACGNSKDFNHSIDIEYFAKHGQINEIEFKLGDDAEEVKTSLSATVDDHGESNYFDYESGKYTIMTDGSVCCCYETTEKEKGITHIIKYGDAYGFTVGAVSTNVRDIMSNLGYDDIEREAKNGELFFLPSSADMTVLEYKIKDTTVLFVFQQHALSATVIY